MRAKSILTISPPTLFHPGHLADPFCFQELKPKGEPNKKYDFTIIVIIVRKRLD